MNLERNHLPTSTGRSLEKISRLLGINLSSYMGRFYGLVLLILFSFLSQISWPDVCTNYCEEHLIRKFMVTLQYILYILLVLTMVGTSLFRPNQFASPHQDMFVIDSILELYGARFSDKDIFFAKYLQDAAIAIITLLVLIKHAYDIIASNSFQLIYYSLRSWYPIVCLLFMDGLFAHYVNDIYLRLRELNKIVIEHTKKENLSVSYIDFITDSNILKKKWNNVLITKLRSIQYIHHRLHVLATKVNTNFGLQLLIVSAICLNAIILLLHDIYHHMKAGNANTKILSFHLVFISCYSLRSLYISYVCQRSRNEFRQMAIILHDIFLEQKLLWIEVIHFSLQLIYQDFTFTAFELYEINLSLICSIAGAIVTYLVMVIQLDTTAKFALINNVTTTWNYMEDNSTNVIM
ncbi:putative gustatory receptor 28b [Pseudomyrmex gracilis]|uniref:putative gustatory receptor 28b n=1 Tax=Pseudomyrmex gracilis TaxID=219809 RepID=UPI000994ADC9|nr:putative gustatory receptor 28b [Pseudomyrmex gracilis]